MTLRAAPWDAQTAGDPLSLSIIAPKAAHLSIAASSAFLMDKRNSLLLCFIGSLFPGSAGRHHAAPLGSIPLRRG